MSEGVELNIRAQPIVDKPQLQVINLEQELALSKLSTNQIEILRRLSAGVLSLYDFALLWSQAYPDNGVEKIGYALGLTNDRELYPSATVAYNLRHWEEGFAMHGISSLNKPEDFVSTYLETITSTGEPIVFFVPKNIFTHPATGVTRMEMEWFLAHPERLSKTTFVFGLYSSIDLETYLTTLPRDESNRIAVLGKILKNPQQYL